MKPNKARHRYYENTFPKVGEFVMVKYSELTHFGTIVKLLEYDEIEGMVVHKEISSRSKDLSRSKLQARVGKTDVCVVLAVDESKSFIDLSRTKVHEDDRVYTRDYFQKSKSLESIFNSLLSSTNPKLDEESAIKIISQLYQEFAWKTYKIVELHPNEALKLISQHHNKIVDSFSDLQLEQIEKTDQILKSSSFLNETSKVDSIEQKNIDILYDIITRKFEQKVSFIRATVDVECFHHKGILAIREALKAAQDRVGVKIRMFCTPSYSIEVKFVGTLEDGKKKLEHANQVISEVIGSYKGTCSKYLILES